jgi:hypothetical protein
MAGMVAVEPEVERAHPGAVLALGESGCSIRIPPSPMTCPCAVCAELFSASGPTGYLDDKIICDDCLLRLDVQLGMVVALVAVTREYGDIVPLSPHIAIRTCTELMAFARVYQRWAGRYSPRRPPVGKGLELFGEMPSEEMPGGETPGGAPTGS